MLRAQSDISYTVYKQQKNKASPMLRKARELYERKFVVSSKRNSVNFFAQAQSNKRPNNRISVLRDSIDNVVVDAASLSGSISNYFALAYRHDNGSHPTLIYKESILMECVQISSVVIENIPLSLDKPKSPGPDGQELGLKFRFNQLILSRFLSLCNFFETDEIPLATAAEI